MITTRQANKPKIKPISKDEREKEFTKSAAEMREKVLTTRNVKLKPREPIDPEKIKNMKSLDMKKALKPGWGRKDK